MRDKTSSGEAAWQEEELSTAALPDKRLARRLRRLLDQMSAAPGKPIPAACGGTGRRRRQPTASLTTRV
ncbi:transposase DNA-binding-containing protein [Mesorhizobium sp. M0323]|uniref:IS4/Tn5 family transposase DNA-binding protein n=1 Tax=Mesorhizobium sp. M0323 TaxID=2956938 RepID=UPI003337535B